MRLPHPLRVLLVEDQVQNQKWEKQLLTNLGCKVDIVKNGLEAVNRVIADKNKYAVLLMDVFMPVMNGIEATKKIREFERENKREKTAIIVVTGNYTKYDRVRALQLDVNDFICKPLEKDVIFQCLKKVSESLIKDKKILILDGENYSSL